MFLFFAGFGSIAAYPLIATVARYTSGPNLGMRMSLIVGGAWGIASLIQMLIGYFAEEIGLHNILLFSSAGYLISAIIGFVIFKHIRSSFQYIVFYFSLSISEGESLITKSYLSTVFPQ